MTPKHILVLFNKVQIVTEVYLSERKNYQAKHILISFALLKGKKLNEVVFLVHHARQDHL